MFWGHNFSAIRQYSRRRIFLTADRRKLWVVSDRPSPRRCDKKKNTHSLQSVNRWWRGCWVRQDGGLCEMGQLVTITGVDSGRGGGDRDWWPLASETETPSLHKGRKSTLSLCCLFYLSGVCVALKVAVSHLKNSCKGLWFNHKCQFCFLDTLALNRQYKSQHFSKAFHNGLGNRNNYFVTKYMNIDVTIM